MHWRFLSVWLSVSVISFTAHGHTLPISFLTIVPDSEYLHLELTFNPFELTEEPKQLLASTADSVRVPFKPNRYLTLRLRAESALKIASQK